MTDSVRLLPDPDQHEALAATLERVNRASNAARARALEQQAFDAKAVRPIVAAASEQAKLPSTFNRPMVDRVVVSLERRAGKQPRFSTYQSLTFPPNALRWGGSDRVTIPTASGRRTVRVRVDMTRGDLRPPLEGRATTLVFRNGEFDLVAAG